MTRRPRKSGWFRLFGNAPPEQADQPSNIAPVASDSSSEDREDARVADDALDAASHRSEAPEGNAAKPGAWPDDPSRVEDYRYLFDQLPQAVDLAGINERVKKIASVSAAHRKNGDKLVKDGIPSQQAMANWELALQLNDKAIEVAKHYKSFDLMFKEDGRPLPGASKSNYPLEGGEQTLAKQFCDLTGREGGLLRRLGRSEKAYEYYAIGAEIERDGANFGVLNSYCTMNAIAIQIELGRRRASPSGNPPPDLSKHIKAARTMIENQFRQGRNKDMWAKADLGMAIVLSEDSEANRADAEEQYYEYAIGSFPDDFDTTVRILSLVEQQLRAMSDPVAHMVTWALGYLHEVRLKKLDELQGA